MRLARFRTNNCGSGSGFLSSRNRRFGAALVEFAVVAPLFFMFLFALIEIGRAVMISQVVVNAAREGVREAALSSKSLSEVRDSVEEYLEGAGIPTAAITPATTTIKIRHYNGDRPYPAVSSWTTTGDLQAGDPTGPDPNDPVAVTIEIPYSKCTWIPYRFMPSTANLTSTSIMRKEGS